MQEMMNTNGQSVARAVAPQFPQVVFDDFTWRVPVSILGWLCLLAAAVFVAAPFICQVWGIVSRKRKDDGTSSVLSRAAARSVVAGWLALSVGIGMTWCGLASTVGFVGIAGTVDPVILVFATYTSCIPGFIGVLIWAVAMLQKAIVRLGVYERLQNTASPIAGKPGSG
jgi:hypothetical protein